MLFLKREAFLEKKMPQGLHKQSPCGIYKSSKNSAAYAFTPLYSSETVSFFLPLARRAANTRRPLAVAILSRKPCLFFLFLLEG